MTLGPPHDLEYSGISASHPPVLGMVGGGQLARMMQAGAVALGVRFRVLAQSSSDPAALAVPETVIGDERAAESVLAFAAGCDVLTFDHEHVPPSVLRAVEAAGHVVRPGSAALAHAQDKALMRRRLDELGVESPRHRVVADPRDVVAFAGELAQAGRGWPVVLKTARGGYDGRGVWMIRSGDDPALADPFKAGVEVLAEEHVHYRRELSALVARSAGGQCVAYPVVESVQRSGICVEVVAPAPALPEPMALKAQQLALRIAGALGVVGLLAVELFETVEARLLVNELAMRPHNTGHWSIEGAVTSQFENHLRAVLNLPLGSPRARDRWTVMVNVLGGDPGEGAGSLHRALLHCLARDPGLKVHLYGKEIRRGRKIGHVTVGGDELADLRRRAWHAADYLRGVVDE